MKRKHKRSIKIYPDIITVMIMTVILAVCFTWIFQKSSEEKVLNTLSEISNQSVSVIQKEVEKNQMILTNVAAHISEGSTKDVVQLVENLKQVDSKNRFKRMGIVRDDHYSLATDGTSFMLDDEMYERFRPAMEGKTTVSDNQKDLVDNEDVTVYATPIEWQDGTRYVLFGTYSVKYYRDTLSVSTFEGEGYTYILKRNGDCVIGSENHNGSSFDNYFDLILEKAGDNAKPLNKAKAVMSEGGSGFVKFQIDSSQRYIYYQPLEINDWYLLSVIPRTVVEKQINGPMFLAYMTVLVFGLGMTYLVYRVYRIQKKNKEMLEEAAFIDNVTGESSYLKFKLDAAEMLVAANEGKNYAAVFLNLLKFQYVNDLYGYEEGDNALRRVMLSIKSELSEDEYAARMQADHFVMLLTYYEREQLEQRIQKILLLIHSETDRRTSETPYELKVCAGIYLAEDRSELIETMLDRASMAMRPEYNLEKNICCFYSDKIRTHMLKNKEIEDRFSEAMQKNEFFLYYQPKFDVKTERFCGAEALVRWKTAEGQMISPGAFIPVLEHGGGIVELDEHVLEMACSQIQQWLEAGDPVHPVSVNVSQLHLYRPDFVECYLNIIDKYQIPHQLIQLEMTETALFGNEDILSETLERIRKRGIYILMDDFGSGYSSVTMLKSMPIDILKIDKSMVDHVEDNNKARKILEGIITLAQSLNIKVTAEGVEYEAQFHILKAMQVDDIQGYYCAKPMPAEQYIQILRETDRL